MTSDELRNYATILAAIIALVVFIYNALINRRKERVESLARFFEVHERLMAPEGFILKNHRAIETGVFQRDLDDLESDRSFHLCLLHIEQLAFLANNHAVPTSTQVYMFGGHARSLLPLLTKAERTSAFWEVAVRYLERLARLADRYEKVTPDERRRFHR